MGANSTRQIFYFLKLQVHVFTSLSHAPHSFLNSISLKAVSSVIVLPIHCVHHYVLVSLAFCSVLPFVVSLIQSTLSFASFSPQCRLFLRLSCSSR